MAMDFIELTKAQVSALLDSPTPLADVYKNWSNMDFNLMDNIVSAIEDDRDCPRPRLVILGHAALMLHSLHSVG